MEFCQDCGTPYEPGSEFCSFCGQRLIAPQYSADPAMDSRLLTNRFAAIKLAKTSLLLLGCGILLDIFSSPLFYSDFYAWSSTYFYRPYSKWDYLGFVPWLISCVLVAIIPIFAVRCASKGAVRSANLIKCCAIMFLALQIGGSVLYYLHTHVYIRFLAGHFMIIQNIPGIQLIGLFESICKRFSFSYTGDFLQFFSCLCYWGVNILCILSASKLKKSAPHT